MAVCGVCEGEMKLVDGCVPSDAYVFGDEPGIEWDPPLSEADTCRDCGALVGHPHHFACCVACCRPCSDAAGELAQWLCCPHFIVQGEALGLDE